MKNLFAVALIIVFGLTAFRDTPAPVQAAPVVVGSPPGEVARLTAELAKANKLVAMLQESLGETCPCGQGKSCLVDDETLKPGYKPVAAVKAAPVATYARSERTPYKIQQPYTYRTGWRGRQTAQGVREVWVYDEGGATYYCQQSSGYSGGSCGPGGCR